MRYLNRLAAGRISRRKAILMLGATMLAARSRAQSDAAPGCVLTPEQTEGPYFVDHSLNRTDIRSDPTDGSMRPGAPLSLSLRVFAVNASGCRPLPGAVVDVWHCDAEGVYSGFNDPHFQASGKKFLRGYQTTDADGKVRFITIYPGWYPGRTVHIHFKVRTVPASGKPLEFTSQLYFDDALTDRVHAQEPYANHGPRRQKNDADGLFRRGGRQLMLSLVEDGHGYAGTFDIGLRMD